MKSKDLFSRVGRFVFGYNHGVNLSKNQQGRWVNKEEGEKAELIDLNQFITTSLKKSNEEKLFNFTLNLCGNSFLMPVEDLISTRYYATQPFAEPLAAEFKDPKRYLEASTPDCGSFSKGFFEFLTKTESNINKGPEYKNTSKLQELVREKKDVSCIIQISVPGHQYSILLAGTKDGKPQGYIYQTNTAEDMGGEKFSIQDWVKNKKNKAIDILDHLSKIDIFLDQKQELGLRKATYETLYTIPASGEVTTPKDLDKLVTIPKEESFIRWEVGNVTDDALKRLSALYKESYEELIKLKHFFKIQLHDDFVTKFSEKLQKGEIELKEEPQISKRLIIAPIPPTPIKCLFLN